MRKTLSSIIMPLAKISERVVSLGVEGAGIPRGFAPEN